MCNLKLKRVSTLEELTQVYRLTYEAYVGAGLCDPFAEKMIVHHPELDVIPSTVILIAKDGPKVVGTNSLTMDSRYGLSIKSEFKAEMERERASGKRIACMWRNSVHPDYQQNNTVLTQLFRATAAELIRLNVDVCFFTFSPRHARIYEKLIGAEFIARGYDNNELISEQHAEVFLMKLDLTKTEKVQKISKWMTEVELG